MNFYAVSALINFITSAVLGVFVIFKSRKSKNVSFFIFCFFVALWSLNYIFWQIAKTPEDALFWSRILMAFAIFIPVAYLHFVYALVEILNKQKKFLIFSYLLFSLFLVSDATPYFISHTEPILNFQFWPIAGPAYTLFLVVWFFYVIYSTYLLYKKYKTSVGIIRSQIKYVAIGMIIGFAGGSTNYFLWYKIPIPPIANILVSVYVGTIAYAILRYRLMDIRVVVKKAFVYFGLAGLSYGVFYIVAWLYRKFFGDVFASAGYILGLAIAPIFVILLLRFYSAIQKIANKYLFLSLFTSQETIARLTDELTNSIDLGKIIDSIVNSIKEAMQLDRAGILLVDQDGGVIKYKIAKVIGFNETNGISLVQDNFLTRYLEKTQKPLVRDELQMIARDSSNANDKQNFSKLAENMKHIEASLCLPMIISNKLIGIIVLGSKISGDAYTSDDLNLLSTLSKQAAIAVDNARLYHEVQDFSKTLQQKVDEQTKEIRDQKDKVEKSLAVEKQAHELEKHANEELKHLDENKTDFMLITQHHLRTPLSVNAGFLDLMLNGTFGKIPAKQKDVVLRLRESTQKEIDVVNELLDVSSYQIGKEMIHLDHPIDFEALMEETLKDLTTEAEAKGIYLKYEKKGDIPKTPADRLKLKLVLTNVIDNCIKYTTSGGVTVSMEVKNDKLLISVTDTGIGLSNEAMQNLFKHSFHRGEKAKRLFAVGKGLGLFLSGKIIEGHHGRIWAESKGDGKGSAFYIELPIKQETNQQLKVENNVNVKIK